MPLLQVGDAAPEFTLRNQDGKEVRLGDFRGKHLLFWWYPKADTPG